MAERAPAACRGVVFQGPRTPDVRASIREVDASDLAAEMRSNGAQSWPQIRALLQITWYRT